MSGNPMIGPGGAPTRCTSLPDDPVERKKYPLFSGVDAYFPDALVMVAHVSWVGNQQHHPDKELFWDRSKSADEADALKRHLMQHGTLDADGVPHSAKLAWRALALLQKEIEAKRKEANELMKKPVELRAEVRTAAGEIYRIA